MCSEEGHISRNREKHKDTEINTDVRNTSCMDLSKFKLDGIMKKVVFNTGINEAMMDIKACKTLGKKVTTLKVPAWFTLINGRKLKIDKSTKVVVEYDGKSINETYNVLDSYWCKRIPIGNQTVKAPGRGKEECETKKIPIECHIETGNASPISCTRSVKSYKDRMEFISLLEELEKRKIVKPSTSTLLNPVVLCRKKNKQL